MTAADDSKDLHVPTMTDPLRALAKLGAQLQHLDGLGIVERHTGTLAECETTRCIEARAALAADTARPCQHPDSYFDRSLCGVDDWMHTRCSECGVPLDGQCAANTARPGLDVDDRAFLRWCHERFQFVFHQSPDLDWMQRLARLTEARP